ncbi:unnamed protein product [Effrenium voratum]|uniref:Secreted protein n=1 Tax=Effrenium voratum TaxID=2562239 RepID=A0AA36IUT6_9DINO|nr:unnamed protein product [Effrenium voratum]
MTGCRCCVFLTIFTLSVVFGKSFPKHVSLVAAGNRSRVQRLRRADLLAVDPIRATGDSLAGHLCGLVSTRPLSSVSGFVLTSRHTVWVRTRQSARVSLEIVTSLSQALRTFELPPGPSPRSIVMAKRSRAGYCHLIFVTNLSAPLSFDPVKP